MKKAPKYGFEEICLYAGKPQGIRSHNVPIDISASYEIRDGNDLKEIFEGKIPVYARVSSSPTVKYAEEKICAMETMQMGGGGARARLCASGMAAVSAVLWGTTVPGDQITVIGPVYGGTYDLLVQLKKNGRCLDFFAARDPKLIEKLRSSPFPRVIFGEMTTNPTIATWDVPAVAEICHKYLRRGECLLVVDSSFLSPYNFRAFDFGADVVVHSATKYLSGRGKSVSGILVASPELLKFKQGAKLWADMNKWVNCSGPTVGPNVASDLGIFMEDLHLRIPAQNANALILASYLSKHKKVLGVYYPLIGAGRELAKKLIRPADGGEAGGAMVSFRIKGGLKAAKWFLFAITSNTFIKHKPSLGYTKTIVESPWFLSQGGMSALHKEMFGITEDLIRVSVGIESNGYILEAFDFALSKT